MILYILLGVAILAAIFIVIAVAVVGVDRFKSLWVALSAPARTIVNVIAGSALAGAVGYLITVAQGEPFDPKVFLLGIASAVGTAIVRALNPLDTAATGGYGLGASSAPSTDGLTP